MPSALGSIPDVRDEIAGFLKALLIKSKSVKTIARIAFIGNKPSVSRIFGKVPSHTDFEWFDQYFKYMKYI